MWREPWSHWPIAYFMLEICFFFAAESTNGDNFFCAWRERKGDEKVEKKTKCQWLRAQTRVLMRFKHDRVFQLFHKPSFLLHPAPRMCLLFISPILCSSFLLPFASTSHRAEKFVVVYCLFFFRICVVTAAVAWHFFTHRAILIEKKSCWTKLRRERVKKVAQWCNQGGFSDPHSKQTWPESIAEKVFSFIGVEKKRVKMSPHCAPVL